MDRQCRCVVNSVINQNFIQTLSSLWNWCHGVPQGAVCGCDRDSLLSHLAFYKCFLKSSGLLRQIMAIEQTARHCWALWYAVISASQLLATKDFLVCTHCMSNSEMVLWLLEGIPSELGGRWGAAGEGDEGALFEVVTKPCISAGAEILIAYKILLGRMGCRRPLKWGWIICLM